MKRLYVVFFIGLMLLASCRSGGKKSMKGDESVETKDFVAFFDDLKLPLIISDSGLNKKPEDSTLIDKTIFTQFISDTIFKADFTKEVPKVYAIGKFSNKKEETYLLLEAYSAKKQAIYAAVLDNKNKFTAYLPLVTSAGKAGSEKMVIDDKFNFTHTTITYAPDGSMAPVNAVYAYNNAGLFMVILTDGLPAGTDLPILDPIDTLTRKGKWAGNYAKDKRNILTIRDDSNAQQVHFFIHIEKKGEQFCDGEIKGIARMNRGDSATYAASTDPCIIGFKFSRGSIRVTETSCGNRHGMECNFNAVFLRQKDPVKPKEPAKPKEQNRSLK